MLIDFSLSNFKSFDYSETDDQSISMIPSAIRSKRNHLTSSGLLKSAVLFGPNSSGKSSFIDGMRFVKSVVTGDHEVLNSMNTLACLVHSRNEHMVSRFSFRIEVNHRPAINLNDSFNRASESIFGFERYEYVYEIAVKFGYMSDYDIVSETIWKVESDETVELCSYHADLDQDYYRVQKDLVKDVRRINNLILNSSILERALPLADCMSQLHSLESRLEEGDEGDASTSEQIESLKNRIREIKMKHPYYIYTKRSMEVENAVAEYRSKLSSLPVHKPLRDSILCSEPDLAKLKRKYKLRTLKGSDMDVIDAIASVYNWFNESLEVINPHKFTLPNLNSDSFIELSRCIRSFDLGIADLRWVHIKDDRLIQGLLCNLTAKDREKISECERISNRFHVECSVIVGDLSGLYMFSFYNGDAVVKKMMTLHENDSLLHDLTEESNGTRRLIELCSILVSHSQDRVFVVDELDCRLHPLVSKRFIEMFFENSSSSNDVQLIISTHETRLMTTDLFRLDEIWLVDRNDNGCSYLHNAADSMKVPYHKRLDKIYLVDQAMGGVPHFK